MKKKTGFIILGIVLLGAAVGATSGKDYGKLSDKQRTAIVADCAQNPDALRCR